MDRYHRQILLPQIGDAGQAALGRATVMLIGVGALGCTSAEQLARAGVGHLVLIDRDVVDRTNLQRQALFEEADVGDAKAAAAARRLAAVNADIRLTPLANDVSSDNVRSLLTKYRPAIVVDGTDNAQTRYLLNDAAIEANVPWVYGACVGVEGRVMPVVPGVTPCLRCLFETPPAAGELPTCDVAGVLGAAAAVVASMQATETIRYVVTGEVLPALTTVDLWTRRFKTIDVTDSKRLDCPACGLRQFDFLNSRADSAATLCGRKTVQIRLAGDPSLDDVARRLMGVASGLERTDHLLRFDVVNASVTVFEDGRVLVQDDGDPVKARSLVARLLG